MRAAWPRWLVVVLILVLTGPVAAKPRRVHVVVVGDPEGAESIAGALERTLASVDTVDLLGVARVAAPPTIPANHDGAVARLGEAIDRFYANEVDLALAELDGIANVLPPSPETHALRVTVATWRAAVLERKWTDGGRAEPVPEDLRSAVRDLLQLDPDVRITIETFWPRFAELIERERRELPRVELRLRDVPTNARVWLQGRKIELRARVVPGRYQLRVAADEHVTTTETLELTRDVELSRPLPVSVAEDRAAAIGDAMQRGQIDRALAQARRASKVTGADVIVLIAADRRSAWSIVHGVTTARSGHLDHGELVAWIAHALAVDVVPDHGRWQVAMRLGFSSSGTVFAWGDSTISTERAGGGLWLVGTREWARWLIRVDASLLRDATVATPASHAVDTPPTTGRVGWDGSIDATVGTRIGGDRLALIPWLRAGLRAHHGGVLEFSVGEDPLTAGYTALALGLGAAARVRILPRTALEASITLHPLAAYLEAPDRAGIANPPELLTMTASISVTLSARWLVELGVAYDRVEIQHVGMPTTPITPRPADVHRVDEAGVFWIGARRTFRSIP